MNRFLIIIILVIYSLSAIAQEFTGGLSGGISATQIDGESQSGYNKLGFIFGGFVKRKFGEKLGAQFEIKYFDKGSHKPPHHDVGDYTTWTIKLRYIDMPFMASYTLKDIYTFQAGVSVDYLLHFAYNDGNGNMDNSYVPYRKFDYSAVAGFSYKISDRLSASVRYSYSMISVLKKHLTLNSSNWFYNNMFIKGHFNNDLGFTIDFRL